ncbi:MAG: glycyl-radical enzyme activating protein [Desulfovibrio sp.]|jgi:pyruvate formate lyase activating enzyme|nr:glycyl-radical enzyme activating protein [Desulfovibrio sp.]
MNSREDRQKTGLVFNIQKYSVHDGPGIRTIVFLKGCPLSCRWCSNPESQQNRPELAYNPGRCLTLNKCVRCLEVCMRNALIRKDDASLRIVREHCEGCHMPCADACPANSLIVYGQERSVEDVLAVVEQDEAFYARSSGGLTVSGGEPLFQGGFVAALLREARRRRYKTAMETCGMASAALVREVAPFLNHMLFDIKTMDSAAHKAQTGLPNAQILENFSILAEEFPDLPLMARTPVIPGFNDTPEAIAAVASFIAPYARVTYELLPYHRLGTQKYHFLDRTPPMGNATLDKNRMPRLQSVAEDILRARVQNLQQPKTPSS